MKYIDILLTEMTIEQKMPIVKILGLENIENKSIINKLSEILLRFGGLGQTSLTYNQFIEKIASKNDEEIDFNLGTANAEKELYLKLFQKEFEKLTDIEKGNIYKELEKAGLDKNQIQSLGGITAIGAAQLSGFGVYLLASSTLGAITSVLGITLPFAFYTGISSVISLVIGPIGFLVMGVLVYRSFKKIRNWNEALNLLKASWEETKAIFIGDYHRGTLVFKYFAATRIVLTENLRKEIEQNSSQISRKKNNISTIDNEIKNNEIEINKKKELKNRQAATISSIEVDIIKIQEELKRAKNELNRINTSIETIKNINIDQSNKKQLVNTDIVNIENESKVKLSKIEKLNSERSSSDNK